jgi:hypothetical protein
MRLWDRTIEQMGPEAREILAAEPPQDGAMAVVLTAWDDVMRMRPMGFDVGLVPTDKMMWWCDRQGMDEESADLLWAVIKRLDRDDRERRNRPQPSAPAR